MKIERIEAKYFRTLKDVSVTLPTFYTTISGKNNAGKSNFVRIVRDLFEEDRFMFPFELPRPSYSSFRTQWESSGVPVVMAVEISLDRIADSEISLFLDDLSSEKLSGNGILVRIEKRFCEKGESISCTANGMTFDDRKSLEISKKLKSVNNLFVYNSSSPARSFHITGGEVQEMLEILFTDEDKQKIEAARKTYTGRIRNISRKHREHLSEMLGRLQDSYDVDFEASESSYGPKLPVGITLNDKAVEVPLRQWGSGTQNRTEILLSVLQAARLKIAQKSDNTTTPVVIVEEPESFLHPSAQAEFGRVLQELAEELQIQIICTTHSPYMLNQRDPASNILLERKLSYGKPKESVVIDTTGSQWMAPFSEQLGIIPPEFENWKDVIISTARKVILVEGDIDVEYFEFFKSEYPEIYKISDGVSIEPYGGKDSIKNTPLLTFALAKYDSFVITFDLDALVELQRPLEKMGFQKDVHFYPIGRSDSGAECIEGLLPDTIKREVYSENVDLVDQMTSGDSNVRKSARNKLKKKALEKLRSIKPKEAELSHFKRLFANLARLVK